MLWNFTAAEHGRYGSMEDCGVSNAEQLPCSFSVYEWAM